MPGFNISDYYELGNIKDVDFIRHNENKIFKVSAERGNFVLRIHQNKETVSTDLIKGDTDPTDQIVSELELLEKLADSGRVTVQRPVRDREGQLVSQINGQPVTVLEWIEGKSISEVELTPAQMYEIGKVIAYLRIGTEKFDISKRIDYGTPLTVRLSDELDKALSESHISAEQHDIMRRILIETARVFDEKKDKFGYVHADLGKSNFLLTEGGSIAVIDHSLSGKCIAEYDPASAYLHFEREGRAMTDKLFEGYGSVSSDIDMSAVQLCECYQIVMFIASRHKNIYDQPWFGGALDYWCGGIMKSSLEHELYDGEVGLYAM